MSEDFMDNITDLKAADVSKINNTFLHENSIEKLQTARPRHQTFKATFVKQVHEEDNEIT